MPTQTNNKTNLQKILDTSHSSDSDSVLTPQKNKIKKKKKKTSPEKKDSQKQSETERDRSRFGLMIPDTCCMTSELQPTAKELPQRFVIRETIDTDNFLVGASPELPARISEEDSNLSESEIDKTQFNENVNTNLMKSNPHLLNVCSNQSTPLSVKKKLQEHGLLDLTNSPAKNPSQPLAKKTNIQNESPARPNKQYQSNCYEEMGSPSIVKSAKSPLKTPIKFLTLQRTPNKSPSLTFRAMNEQENSKDVSGFEPTFKIPKAKSKKNEAAKNKKLMVPANPNYNIFEKSQFDLFNEIPSPRKSVDTSMRPQKRFKQLTMTQAFATQQEKTPTKEDTTAKNASKSDQDLTRLNAKAPKGTAPAAPGFKDLDETCLPPSFPASNAGFVTSTKNSFGLKQIKNEPSVSCHCSIMKINF